MKKIIYTCALACLFTESKTLVLRPGLKSYDYIVRNWTTKTKEKSKQSYSDYMSKKPALTRVLTAAHTGDSIHSWDCSYVAPNNGEYIYNLLKEGKTVPDDISKAPYASWFPTLETVESAVDDTYVQPHSSTITGIFTLNGKQKFCDDNYAFIEEAPSEIAACGPYFIDSPRKNDEIKNIMKKSGAAFVFLINKGNHWFTTVAHKKDAEPILYMADDTPKEEDYYKEPLAWVKEICGFYNRDV